MNNFLCYNCQGQGHRSSQCQFAPTHRRCPTCGKAGGNHAHREGCSDSWYDLSVRVPRFKEDNRTTLTKQQVEAILLEGYLSERSDHQLIVPDPNAENRAENALSRDEHNESRDRESINENLDGSDERCASAITGLYFPDAGNHSENVRDEFRCAIAKNENVDCCDDKCAIGQMDDSIQLIVPDPNAENRAENALSRDEHDENRDRESINENVDGCDERCASAITGLYFPDAGNQSENVRKEIRCVITKNENVDCRNEECAIGQMDDSLSLVQAENTIAHIFHENKVASKTLFLRFSFSEKPEVFIGSNTGYDRIVAESATHFGLEYKYANGCLDFYGRAHKLARFIVTSAQASINLTIDRDVVITNGSIIFGEIEITIYAGCSTVPKTKYVIAMNGSTELQTGIRYRTDTKLSFTL